MQVSGEFTGTGTSLTWEAYNTFTISISGFGEGTIVLQRSFDDGATWLSVESFTADFEGIVLETGYRELVSSGRFHRKTLLYRFNCTAYTSGTLLYRAGQ